METFRQHRVLFQGKVVVTQIDARVMSEIFKAPVLGKSSCRKTEHLQWIAPQGMQRRFLCDLTGARSVQFHLLPSIDQIVRFETLVVSRRQLFDVKLIALFDDARQTLI
jgi:hypothetical protein